MTQKLQQTLQDRSDIISKEIKLQSEALKRREDSSDILVTQTLDKISETIRKAVDMYEFSGGMIASATEIQDAIRKTLLYPAMEVRYGSIVDAHAQTFTWILNPSTRDCPWDNFMEWLRVEDDIYWVTLLKFLLEQSRVRHQLRQWAGDKALVCASFWSSQ
jgi:hypothetical protein